MLLDKQSFIRLGDELKLQVKKYIIDLFTYLQATTVYQSTAGPNSV